MPSLAGAITTLGLAGLSIAAPLWDSEYTTVPRPYTQTFTKLGLGGLYGPYAVTFSGKSVITDATVSGSDVWFVSWVEGDVDQQFIESADLWRASWSETASIVRRYDVEETWSAVWTESVALGISGVTSIAGTDAWSASWTESAALNITAVGTDTWTVSWSEAGVVDTVSVQKAGTDAWAVSWSEAILLDVFTGLITRVGDDFWTVGWDESADVLAHTPSDPYRIRIIPRTARIRIVLK